MQDYVVVRGAGDLATGVIQKLYRSGFNVIATEIEKPSAIRRLVSLGECVYEGTFQVEDIISKRISDYTEIEKSLGSGFVPVVVDPNGSFIEFIKPIAVIDAIIAKKNLGTTKKMAAITIALGPGFNAPEDVDCVIETVRGHDLGRLIFNGSALPNTGFPGEIMGRSIERVIHSPVSGEIETYRNIGDIVKQGEVIAKVGSTEIFATIDGVLRGLIRNGFYTKKGLKIADIDPRISEIKNCSTISDKARNLGGAVLEAFLYLKKEKRI